MVGSDSGGRHGGEGSYLTVAAAVHARTDSTRIRSTEKLGLGFAVREGPTLDATSGVTAAVGDLSDPPDGRIIAEHDDFDGEPPERVGVSFRPEFKYVESISERETVQAAHHAACAARDLRL